MRRAKLAWIMLTVALLPMLLQLFRPALAQDETGVDEPSQQESQLLAPPQESTAGEPDFSSPGLEVLPSSNGISPMVIEQAATSLPPAGIPAMAGTTTQDQPSNGDFSPIRVRVGGDSYTDSEGRVWAADNGFSGGGTAATDVRIAGTNDSPLFQGERIGEFSYEFPVPNGVYTVTLRFAEWYWNNPGERLFDVSIEGQPFLTNFDILAHVPRNTALDQWAVVQVTDGALTIGFANRHDSAKLAALEIVAGDSPPIAPAPIAGATGEGPQPASGSILRTGGGTMSIPSNPDDTPRGRPPAQAPVPAQPPAPGSAQPSGQIPTDPPAEPTSTAVPASGCGGSTSMVVTAVPSGIRFQAQGFAPGTLVQAWTLGPVRDGEAVPRPDRGYDATYTADESCRVADTMGLVPTTFGRYGVYLAGERFGGGPALVMFQLIQMSPSSVSTTLSGNGTMATESAPEAPSGVVARAVDRATIRLEWVDNSRNEQGFRIEITSGGTGAFAVPSNVSSYSVSGLRPDTDYCFTVKAFNGSGASSGADACARTAK